MSRFAKIRSKADLIGMLNPQAWDALKPKHDFPFKNATIELFVADAVKEASTFITDKKLAKDAFELSRKMAESASASLVAGWEPGDDLCPPRPWPWARPGPWWTDVVAPQPEPWKTVKVAEQIELAHILTQFSGLTSSKDFNVALKGIATGIARGVAAGLVEDFEKCGTVPRPPIPRPRYS